jgi:membrane protein DedA with SNARE-associated domain
MHEIAMKIFSLLSDLGYIGIVLGLIVEVIPSEIVLAYGGFLISQGEINYFGATLAGVVGGIIAQLILYYLGYFGGRPAVLKYGKYIFIKEKHVIHAEKWFEKYGAGVVFTARFIPVVRHAISIPAGMAKMNVWKFIIYTGVAAIPWSILFLTLGKQLGNNWVNVSNAAHSYTTPIILVAILFTIIYVVFKICRKKKAF